MEVDKDGGICLFMNYDRDDDIITHAKYDKR